MLSLVWFVVGAMCFMWNPARGGKLSPFCLAGYRDMSYDVLFDGSDWSDKLSDCQNMSRKYCYTAKATGIAFRDLHGIYDLIGLSDRDSPFRNRPIKDLVDRDLMHPALWSSWDKIVMVGGNLTLPKLFAIKVREFSIEPDEWMNLVNETIIPQPSEYLSHLTCQRLIAGNLPVLTTFDYIWRTPSSDASIQREQRKLVWRMSADLRRPIGEFTNRSSTALMAVSGGFFGKDSRSFFSGMLVDLCEWTQSGDEGYNITFMTRDECEKLRVNLRDYWPMILFLFF
jgi:hypothetical protein